MNRYIRGVGLIFVLSLLSSSTAVYAAQTVATTTDSATTATATAKSTPEVRSVEDRVRSYFSNIPIMIEVARCESKFRQFADSGNVLRGGAGGEMIGVFQFYESVHKRAALALGLDFTTLEGNLAYAKHVYEIEGTSPWNSARACWEVAEAAPSETVTPNPSYRNNEQQIELLLKIIALLQILLQRSLASG